MRRYYVGPNLRRGLEEYYEQGGEKTVDIRERLPLPDDGLLPPIYCPNCGAVDVFETSPPDTLEDIEPGLRPFLTIRVLVHIDEDGRVLFNRIDHDGRLDVYRMVETLHDLDYVDPEWFACKHCGYEIVDVHDIDSCAPEICEYTGDYLLRTDEPTNCCVKCHGEDPKCLICKGRGRGDKIRREDLIQFCASGCWNSDEWMTELRDLIREDGKRLDLTKHSAGICEGCMHSVDMNLFDIFIPDILERRNEKVEGIDIGSEEKEGIHQGILSWD